MQHFNAFADLRNFAKNENMRSSKDVEQKSTFSRISRAPRAAQNLHFSKDREQNHYPRYPFEQATDYHPCPDPSFCLLYTSDAADE